MRKRLLPLLAVFGLMLAARPVLSAGEKKAPVKAKPVIVLQIKALDDLIADGRYLFALAQQAEFGKQLEKLLQARTGPKGLEGVDTKKPIGLYGSLKTKLDKSEAVLLLPIADEKAFLAVLDNLDIKPKKDAGGLYTADVENVPYPVLFRFANGYLYGTLKSNDRSADLLAKDKLPLPATVLTAGADDLLSLTLNVDQVPTKLKEIASGALEGVIDTIKDKEPAGETKEAKALRETALDEAGRQLKAVLTDGSAVTLRVNVDRKANDLSLELALAGKAGSGLAKDVKSLAGLKSIAASLVSSNSAANAGVNVQFSQAVCKQLGPLVDAGIQKALDDQANPNARDLFKVLLDSLKPTAKSGRSDFGFDLRGPSKKGLYTLVAATSAVEGEGIEQAIKKVLDKLPAEAKGPFTLDVDKAGGVHIHRITPEKGKIDANTRKTFGDGPFYIAIRKDALFFSIGENALSAIKHTVATAPKVGQPFHLEVSLASLAALASAKQKAYPGAAKQAFKAKGSDKVRLTLAAGNALRIKISAKGQVVTFGALLKKAQDEANEN